MAGTISFDAFTCSYLLSFGLLFVAAMWMGAAVSVPLPVSSSGALAACRSGPIGSRTGLSSASPRRDRVAAAHVPWASDIPGLGRYARQFEEAIETIWLSHRGFRGRGGKLRPFSGGDPGWMRRRMMCRSPGPPPRRNGPVQPAGETIRS